MRWYLTKQALRIGVMLSTFFFVPAIGSAETQSLTIEEAIELALQNNRQIEQSAEDREAARWNLSAVRRSSGLRLNWYSTANRIGGRYYHDLREARYQTYGMTPEERKTYASYYNRSFDTLDYPLYQSENANTLTLSMPLYTGGQLENQRKAARYSLNTADLSLENSKQVVKWQTSQAYYRALQYRNNIDVQQEAINLLNAHLRTVQIQYEVGTVAMSDVLATNVQLANSQQAYNTAQGNYENALAELNNIIGLPENTDLVLTSEQSYSDYDLSEAECLNYALEHRPDGIAAMYAVKQAEARVDSTKSGFRPTVSAIIRGSIVGEGAFKADHNGGQEHWTAGLQLDWNIFDNHVTSANVQEAKAQQRKAESQARQQIEEIRLDIREAYTNLKVAEKNIGVTFGAVKQAEEQFLIAKVRYEEGVDTNLIVMDAQEKLTTARINYYSAIYNFYTSRAQLEKAMGVPIGIDAAIYANKIDEGTPEPQALKDSAQVPLEIFDEKGKVKRRSAEDIRPIIESAEASEEPFTEEAQ